MSKRLGLMSRKQQRPTGIFAVENYRILYNRIPKVGCTNWLRVLVYMAAGNNLTFDHMMNAAGAKIHGYYRKRYLGTGLKNSRAYPSIERDVKYRLKNYYKFIFVRHPLDRLLSAYNSKFNTTKWFRKLYLRSYGPFIVNNITERSVNGTPDYVTFEEFLRYVVKAPKRNMNNHWSPYFEQFSFCDPTWTYDFIGHYETMNEDADYLLDLWKVPDIRFPPAYKEKELAVIRFRNAFASIPEDVINAIWYRYFPDFALFGYKKLP